MIKLIELIDQRIASKILYKQNKPFKKYNKVKNGGGDVFVVLKKDKKKHYIYVKGSANDIQITDLDGKNKKTIKPTDVEQIVQLPQRGYVSKNPELKKYGYRD